jgi:hypothetical protein
MKFYSITRWFLPCLAMVWFLIPAMQAQSTRNLPGFPAESVDDVVVPVPSEVFNVLDKLGSPNWRAEYREVSGRNTGNRAQAALLLGTVIADGFVAVEAEDSEKVKDIGREVLNLAEAINVRDAVISRAKSITDKAERKRWNEVRKEFDGALQDVRGAMQQLNDEDLAQLVSLGGWIRGTQVLTSIVTKEFKAEKAELLHQPDLIAYFGRRIEAMPRKLRTDPIVAQIHKTLPLIRPLVGEADGTSISLQDVQKINGMSSSLVESITTGKPGTPGR